MTTRVIFPRSVPDSLFPELAGADGDLLITELADKRGTPAAADVRARVLEVVRAFPRAVAAEPAITERQADVLRLLAQGQSIMSIARALGVSPAMAETHVARLIAILGAANRTDPAMKAGARGLL